MNLSEALDAVVNERFYAKAGQGIVLTLEDVPSLIGIVANGLYKRGHSVTSVEINLYDKKEIVDIFVKNNATKEKADMSLEWRTSDGTYLVRVDTDGDGK